MPRGSIQRRHFNKNFEPIGVFSGADVYLGYIKVSTAQEGMTYYDTTLNQLRTHDGTSWSNAGSDSQSAGSLDDAANQGTKITIDGAMTTGIEIQATDAVISDQGALLLLDNDDTGSDIHGLEITNAGLAASIQITNAQASDDIQGTSDTWAITSAGAAVLTEVKMGNNEKLLLGDSSDIEMYFDGTDLQLLPIVTTETLKIGNTGGTLNFDIVLYSGTIGDYIYFNSDLATLRLVGVDLEINDDARIELGSDSDIIIKWDDGNSKLDITGDNKRIDFGANGAGLDIYWHTEAASSRVFFDEDNSDVDFDAVTLSMNDDDAINFGDNNDMVLSWSTSGTNHLYFAPAAGDAPIVFGNGTTDPIITMYAGGTQNYWSITPSSSLIQIAGVTSRYHDNSPIVMGSSQDVTLQWNGADDKFDITVNTAGGYIHFNDDVVIGTASSDEENLTVNGNVTITGTLTHTGTFNPTSLALDDTETLTFGTGIDYTIATAGSTAALIISATNANDSITIGDGSVDTDFRIDNASGSSNDFLFDASGDGTNGELLFGVDGKGFDVKFFGESPSSYVKWDQSADQLLIEASTLAFGDGDKILFGDTLGTGDISVESTAGVLSWLPEGGGEIRYGADTNGIDCTWFAVSAGDYMKWDESGNSTLGALIFEDSAIQFVGAACTYTFAISTDAMLISATDNINSILTLGTSGNVNGMDVIWTSTTSGDDLILDAGSKTVTLSDLTLVLTDDTVAYSFAHVSNALTLTATDNANAQLTIGSSAGTNSIDLLLQSATAASQVTWDGQTNAIAILNGTVDYNIVHSTNTLLITATDSADAKIAIGNVATTNSVDLELISAIASNTVTWDGGTNAFSFNNGTVDYSFDHATNSLVLDATQHSGAKFIFGTSGAQGLDVVLQGATAGDNITWDAGAGSLAFTDGTNTYTTICGASNELKITATDAASAKITIGDAASTNSIDLELISATAANIVAWNGGTNAITISNGTTTYTIDHATNSLAFTATDIASAMITIGATGGTNSCDFQLIGASASETITYDGADNSLTFADGTVSYTLDHATNNFQLTATDNAAAKFIIGATGTTNGVDFQLNTVTSGEDIIFDAADKTFIFDNVNIILGDSDSIGFGDAAGESTIISDGSNTEWIIANGAVQIGDGGGTNFTQIASTGAITFSGTGKFQRTIPIDHMALALAGTSDNTVITGTGSTNLDTDGETFYGTFRMPADWDGASDMTLIFAIQNAIAETDNDDISIIMDVWGIADGEANPGTGQAPLAALNLTGGDQNINAVNHVEVTIDYNDAGNEIAADDVVCFSGAVELGAGTECTGPLHIIGCWVEYTASSHDQV